MSPGCKIELEFEQTSGGYSIVITQDSDMIAITNKAAALKLADEIRELANTRWTDNPMPTDGSHRYKGYAELIERGE